MSSSSFDLDNPKLLFIFRNRRRASKRIQRREEFYIIIYNRCIFLILFVWKCRSVKKTDLRRISEKGNALRIHILKRGRPGDK